MGVVHLALDPEGHEVAIKVLAADKVLGTEDTNARRRLAREVDTMRRVRSPFVAEVLDADLTGEFPYIVTRYVAGPTLDQMVRERGRLSSQGLRRLAYGTAEALAAIHAAGVVHRDLKPGNVMLAEDRPVVIDFGIAQAGDATRLTQTGLVMGTPGYLAPEVIEGRPSSPASDVHSWGATMAFAATGRTPYPGDSYEQIFFRIVSGQPDLDGVPVALLPLVSSALARDPARRPAATWLSAQASNLDFTKPPAAVFPPTHTMLPPGPALAPAASPPGGPAPGQAYPGPRQAARDVADLLPPVAYAPARSAPRPPTPAPVPVSGVNGSPPGWAPSARTPAPGAQPGPQPGPQYGAQYGSQYGPLAPPPPPTGRGRPMLAGLAVLVAAVALAVLLPVAGLIVSLAGITLLRAADRAQSALAVRRSVRGPRASDPLVVVVTAPWAVVRALLTEVLMAPLAFGAGVAVYAAAILLTHLHLTLPRAGACAAGAMVAWYAVGPGSGRPRRQLNRMAAAVSRGTLSSVVIAVAAWGLAAAIVLLAASQAPDYWPVATPHLPALHGLFSSVTHWLLKHAHA